MRFCTSALKYISVFRQTRRSTFEIGASWMQVVAAEDDGAPQLPVEDDLVPRSLEVLGDHRLGNVLELPFRVDRLPRFRQRFLVDVGCVDLDALAHRRPRRRASASIMADGVRLLAGRAAGAPDAERIAVGSLRRADTGTRSVDAVRPDLRIAEERRDVDEDGVEERGELLVMDLEVVEVLLERLDCPLLHPLHEAAHQARALVDSEIEAAASRGDDRESGRSTPSRCAPPTHLNVPQRSRLKQR